MKTTSLSLLLALVLTGSAWAQARPVAVQPYVPPRPKPVAPGNPALAIYPNLQKYFQSAMFFGDFQRRYDLTRIDPRSLDEDPAPPIPTVDLSRAKVTLHVPITAEVWIEGQKMEQLGAERAFHSPPLDAGRSYRYRVVVKWSDNGKPREQTLVIPVRAGETPVIMVMGGA